MSDGITGSAALTPRAELPQRGLASLCAATPAAAAAAVAA